MNRDVNDLVAKALEASCRLPVAAVVKELAEVLGTPATALIGGVKNARSVYQWLAGERQPERLHALRFALQLMYVLRAGGENDRTIAAWFDALNVRLGDATPVAQLAASAFPEHRPSIMTAALEFLNVPEPRSRQMFEVSLNAYTMEAEEAVRRFVSTQPPATALTEGMVGSRCADRYLLTEPSFDPEPESKNLSSDGITAVYRHRVDNTAALQYKPSTFAIGGWPCRMELAGDRLSLSLEAATNPPTRTRHAQIVSQIQTNVATLSREVSSHNARVAAAVRRALAEHAKRSEQVNDLLDTM
jgi:hypothetical protein